MKSDKDCAVDFSLSRHLHMVPFLACLPHPAVTRVPPTEENASNRVLQFWIADHLCRDISL